MKCYKSRETRDNSTKAKNLELMVEKKGSTGGVTSFYKMHYADLVEQ